jgi:hypothetical protein
MDQLPVTATSTACASPVTIYWDPEAFVLEFLFAHARTFEKAEDELSRKIDEVAGVQEHGFRISVGDLQIALNPNGRLASVEIRRNPAYWQTAELRPPPPELTEAGLAFHVDYDSNNIASIDMPVDVVWDRDRRQLCLRFGEVREILHWYRLAENAVIGVSVDSMLGDICFSDIQLGIP